MLKATRPAELILVLATTVETEPDNSCLLESKKTNDSRQLKPLLLQHKLVSVIHNKNINYSIDIELIASESKKEKIFKTTPSDKQIGTRRSKQVAKSNNT